MSRYQPLGVETLLDSADIYKESDAIKAYDFIESALELIIQNNDKENEVRAYSLLGDINFNSEQYDLSIENYTKSISLAESINKSDLSYSSRKKLGIAFKSTNDYEN